MQNLTGGRLLARNTLWNLGTSLASISISLFCVPILLHQLGVERFGVITLVWIVEGQFGIFDLGLGQALTKLVSEKLGGHDEHQIPAIFWTSLLIMSLLGVAGGGLLRLSAPWIVASGLKVPSAIHQETLTALHLVALSLPAVIGTSALRGFISAHQRFDLLSMVRLPMSLLSYIVPLLVLPFSNHLGPFILVLVLARLAGWIIHLILCFRIAPDLQRITIKGAPRRELLRFGGWLTLTNIVSPIMVNMDRVLIGSLVSIQAVAYYATPYEAATRLWIIPSALTGVLFPAFATALVQNRDRAALLFESGVKYIFIVLFPLVLAGCALGPLGLRIWLGAAFAEKSSTVLRFLLIGVFANSLAQVPFWQIQAANRPDWAAKVHLIELPCYLLLFWKLTLAYGIEGASAAWMLRTSVDAAIMFWLSSQVLVEARAAIRRLCWAAGAVSPLFVASILIKGQAEILWFVVMVLVVFALLTWFLILTEQERELTQNPLRFLLLRESSGLRS